MNGETRKLLEHVVEIASEFLDGLPERPVGPSATAEQLHAALGGELPQEGSSDLEVIDELAAAVEPGLMGTTSGRFFGFVIGGALPSTIAADWLTSVWDQNSGLYAAAPAEAVVEDVAAAWLLELLGLPPGCAVGFVTGAQMANFTGLAVARHHVLESAGWDVEAHGLQGAPKIRVVAGEERHATIDRALRFLGLGRDTLELVPADDQGRLSIDALPGVLGYDDGPLIVCTQAGNVNTGSFDPVGEICDIVHERGGWVHVDGAFGLWAAVSEELRHLVTGVERADSWGTDAHKWLNVPYDCGIVISAHPETHAAALGVRASYLIHSGMERDAMSWVPEFSRRARGFTVYTAIKALGRIGITAMVERCCKHARTFAVSLGSLPDVEILNDVVLNQVLVRFIAADDAASDARTKAIVEAVQSDGTCWLSGSTWKGKGVMRISVSNWSTSDEDVEMSVEAITRIAASI
ncbi:MAG TPA: aminotransferase class V-fold PLP-dependent enzyme [Actinomycetota bacterium]|nr:aminotransferase class V-fold PLP-dependent enzyme [Actinomycetota bacterium]